MDENMQYSAEKIREIQTQCGDLLHIITQRADLIRQLSHETLKECGHLEEASLTAVELSLQQVIRSYRTQLDHLSIAADLYDKCSNGVYLAAEQMIEKGGGFR